MSLSSDAVAERPSASPASASAEHHAGRPAAAGARARAARAPIRARRRPLRVGRGQRAPSAADSVRLRQAAGCGVPAVVRLGRLAQPLAVAGLQLLAGVQQVAARVAARAATSAAAARTR